MATSVYILKRKLSKGIKYSITIRQKGTKTVRTFFLNCKFPPLMNANLDSVLMGFGFCIPYNPYDRVAVRLDRVESDTHRKLRDIIPSHWQSETWNPNESVFYLQSPSQYVSGCSSMLGIPTLSCLRGISPELTKSVYTIIVEHTKALPKEALNEKQIWVATIDVLLHQMENSTARVDPLARAWDFYDLRL